MRVTHLSLIRSRSWRAGQVARKASYSRAASSRRWAAVRVGMALLVVRYALSSTYFPEESSSPKVGSSRTRYRGENDMRAVVARQLDGPDAIEVIETAVPEPGPGQVRIKVTAAAVNPVDRGGRRTPGDVRSDSRPGAVRPRLG